MSSPTSHDFNIFCLARAGDAEAKELLFKIVSRVLIKSASRVFPSDLQSKGAPSDLVQESLLVAHREFDQFNGSSVEEWVGWLQGILRHQSAHFSRSYRDVSKRDFKREVSAASINAFDESDHVSPSRFPGPPDEAIRSEKRRLVFDALARLPESYRRSIELRYWEGFTFREIGKALGCSEEGARSMFGRAMRKLSNLDAIRTDE